MPVKHETSTRFMDEIRIISPWVYWIAPLGFLPPIAAAIFSRLHPKAGDPILSWPVLVPLVLFCGVVIACYVMLIGYVNADAGRRGMSRLGWTLLAIFVPNALGIVLYFVLRRPRTMHCPQCSTVVEPGFGFCPRCRFRLNATCPQCQRGVHEGDKFCPYCSCGLGTSANPVSTPVPSEG